MTTMQPVRAADAACRLGVTTIYSIGDDVLHGGEVWTLRGVDAAGGFVTLARDNLLLRVHACEVRAIGQPVRIEIDGE